MKNQPKTGVVQKWCKNAFFNTFAPLPALLVQKYPISPYGGYIMGYFAPVLVQPLTPKNSAPPFLHQLAARRVTV